MTTRRKFLATAAGASAVLAITSIAAVAALAPVPAVAARDEMLEEIMSLFRRLSPAEKVAYLKYARCLSTNDEPGMQAALEEMRALGWSR